MEFVSHDVARRVEGVDAVIDRDYALRYAKDIGITGEPAIEIAGGWASFAGIDSPLTQAFGIGMSGVVTESEMERLEEFYSSRASRVNLEVCPYVDPSLIELLGDRVYRPVEFSHVLLRPVTLQDIAQAPTASTLKVREVASEEEPVWSRTVASAFLEGAEPPQRFIDIFAIYFRVPSVRCLVAEIDGTPVGGGLVAIHEGMAALATTSTLPAFRGRGVQTALIKARLRIAAEQGCDLAMITTQPGTISHKNVERQGFRVAYTRCKFSRP
jgi:GNAT superfamily N-acetyltransferase